MNWNKWIRQTHRWLSIAFTVAVIVNGVAVARGRYSSRMGLLAVFVLAIPTGEDHRESDDLRSGEPALSEVEGDLVFSVCNEMTLPTVVKAPKSPWHEDNLVLFVGPSLRRVNISLSVIPTGGDHRESDDLRSGGTLCLVFRAAGRLCPAVELPYSSLNRA